MEEKKKSNLSVLLDYAGNYKGLTFLGMFLSAVSMVLGMLPYICIWLAVRDLVAAAPNWREAFRRRTPADLYRPGTFKECPHRAPG